MEWHYALHIAREKGGFKAMVLGHPAVRGYGPTRESAIHQAEEGLRQAVANGEIVAASVEMPDRNPWMEDAGMWKDIPEEEWTAYQQAIGDYRRELAEDETVSGDGRLDEALTMT